jgi:DhnA family fructose-bisphosphate aldolase class Ia
LRGAIETALRLDAACVVANLFVVPGAPGLHEQCVDNIGRLRFACDRYGMPLMVEPIAMKPRLERLGVDDDVERIVPLVRQAVELGADIIKAVHRRRGRLHLVVRRPAARSSCAWWAGRRRRAAAPHAILNGRRGCRQTWCSIGIPAP